MFFKLDGISAHSVKFYSVLCVIYYIYSWSNFDIDLDSTIYIIIK